MQAAGRYSGAARLPMMAAGQSSRARISIARISWMRHGNPIDKRNAWQTRSLLYVRLIPPGAADVAHYRVRIPKDVKGPLTFTARLQYRKFAHAYTQFAYAGQPRAGQPDDAVGKGLRRSRILVRPGQHSGQRFGPDQGSDSGSADHHAGDRDDHAAGRRRVDANGVAPDRGYSPAASGGTTGASGCCCRAT